MKAVASRLGHTSTRMMDTVYVEVYSDVSRQLAAGVAWGLAFAVVWRHRRARAVGKARVDGSTSVGSLLNAAAIAALVVEIIAFMAYASGGR
jgi:hypothetical protein